MIFLEIKYDHQGFTVGIRCEFRTLWGEGGMHDIKRENICHSTTYRLYVLRNVAMKNTIACSTSSLLSVPQ